MNIRNGYLFRILSTLDNFVKEFFSWNQFHDQKELFFIFKHFKQFQDVFMSDIFHDLDFSGQELDIISFN